MALHIRNFRKEDLATLRRMYGQMPDEALLEMVAEWNTFCFDGKYFESFALCDGETVVGNIFLCQHSGYIVSAGPEIFPEYRRRGYGLEGLRLAYEHAKTKGYKIASAQMRKDNIASIRLHEKLGFFKDTEIVNFGGSETVLYLKLL